MTAILKSMASYLLHIFNWSSWASSTLRGLKNTSQLIKSNGKAFNPAPASQGILLQNFWLAAGSEFVTLVLRNLVFSLPTQYFFPCAAGQTRGLWGVKRRERISFRFKQAAFLKLKESAPTTSRVALTSLVVTGFPLPPQEIQWPLLDGESRWLQVVLKQQRFFHYKCAQTSVVFKHITWPDGTMSWQWATIHTDWEEESAQTQPSDRKETKIQLGRHYFFPLPFMQNKPCKFIVE